MRIRSLDSLRGVGALTVLVGHCLLTTHALPQWMYHFPLTLVLAGEGSVLIFFALSGFVLFHPFRDGAAVDYVPYVLRRFVRIYPPFIVAVLGSALLCDLIQPHPIAALTDWFNGSSWQVPVTIATILGHFALTDLKSLQGFDNVMWSLVQEMRLSLIYPLIALSVIRNWRAAVAGSFLISTTCIAIESKITIAWAFDPLLTLSYVFLFTAGAALAHNADHVRRLFSRVPVWCTVGLWIVALRLITVPVERDYSIETSGAALLIITLCFATASADRFLALEPLRWLGKVSYSLYLVHLPILLTYVHLFYGQVPLPILLLAVIATALLAAEPMHRWVEAPSVALAQRVSTTWIRISAMALRRALTGRVRTASHVIAE